MRSKVILCVRYKVYEKFANGWKKRSTQTNMFLLGTHKTICCKKKHSEKAIKISTMFLSILNDIWIALLSIVLNDKHVKNVKNMKIIVGIFAGYEIKE